MSECFGWYGNALIFMFLIESATKRPKDWWMYVCSIVYWKFSVINFRNFFLLNVTFRKFPVLSFIHYKACQEELSEPDAFKIRHQYSIFWNKALMFQCTKKGRSHLPKSSLTYNWRIRHKDCSAAGQWGTGDVSGCEWLSCVWQILL